MTPRDRITRYLSLIVLLFLVCACSNDDDDPGIIAPESLAFTSGLADGGITPEAQLTLTGTVPNPILSLTRFGGTVVIHLNDETIKAESVTRVDGAWRFSRPLTLQPGNNTLRLEVRDADGDLFAAAAPCHFTAALPGDAPLTVSVVDAPGLDDYAHEDDFPSVHLTVDVRDADNSAVNGLTASAFTIIDAGLAVPPDDFTDNGDGTYRLTCTDITCGRRNLRIYVTTGDHAGVSAPHTYGTNHALLAGINRYPSEIIKTVDAPHWSALGTTEVLAPLTPDQPARNESWFQAEMSATGSAPFIPCKILDVDITDDAQVTCSLRIQRPDNAPDQPLIIRYLPIPWLDYCVNDVTDIGAALQAPAHAWQAADITTLTDDQATEEAITGHMARIAHDMKPWDLFFFHYSGHGSTDRYDPQNTASQCLCTFEAAADGTPDPTNLGISVTELGETLSAFKAPGNLANVIVSLDSCFSGNFVQIPLNAEGAEHAACATTRTLPSPALSAAPESQVLDFSDLGRQINTFSARNQDISDANIIILTAAASRERSWDAGLLQNGVYSYHLARALSAAPLGTAPANTDHNPWISNEELFEQVQTTTLDWTTDNLRTTQTPQFKDNDPATPSRMLSND